MKTTFPVVIEQDEDNVFIVSCPIFRGCHSYGFTLEEAMSNISEAIELCHEENKIGDANHFIGIREIELEVA